jgi:hypothetical protein
MADFASFAKRGGGAVLTLFVVVYASDYALLRYRMGKPSGADGLGTVTSYYGTALKDGKMEIFTDQPLTETCVHSIFPHSGLRPCWYASRNNVKPIG